MMLIQEYSRKDIHGNSIKDIHGNSIVRNNVVTYCPLDAFRRMKCSSAQRSEKMHPSHAMEKNKYLLRRSVMYLSYVFL